MDIRQLQITVRNARAAPGTQPSRRWGREACRQYTKQSQSGRGGLGVDDGLWIIDDLGRGNGCRRRRAISTPSAPNKPNLAGFWAKNGGGEENKPNLRGQGPPLGIADCRLGIRGRGSRVHCVDIAPNKPNHPICRGRQPREALHIEDGGRRAKNKANLPGGAGANGCGLPCAGVGRTMWACFTRTSQLDPRTRSSRDGKRIPPQHL
jgi:hypothetical protein